MLTHATKFLIGKRFIFDPNDNSLIDKLENNELIRLGSNESRALSLLIEDPSAIITRQRIHDFVWREQGFEVDDSSLTQAISTLRKALKDSTKSPAFVKTVPKRGYQIIASVEPYIGNDNDDKPVCTASEKNANNDHDTSLTGETESSTTEAITNRGLPSQQRATYHWVLLILALVLPIAVHFSPAPTSTTFRQLPLVDGITISTPLSNPEVNQWHGVIQHCVMQYLNAHQGDRKPTEVIVTGGQNNQLFLSYLHPNHPPIDNMTLRLLTNTEDSAQLCQ